MIARSFYFLRHGETDANLQQILQGSLDVPLNDTGRAQAAQAAEILQHYPIDRVIASPQSRAAETAEIVNRVLSKPISFEPRLKERHFGLYEGLNPEQIAQWKIDNNYHNPPLDEESGYPLLPDGETYAPFRSRIVEAITEALETYPDDSILFVSHGAVFTTLYKKFFGENIKTKNANPYHFNYTPDKWLLNCLVTEHAAKQKATS